MNKIIDVDAGSLRMDLRKHLDLVWRENASVRVLRYGEPIAMIVPIKNEAAGAAKESK